MFVRPATPDLKVRDPERGDHLPAGGRDVPNTVYWRRRRRDGDVVEGEPARSAAPETPIAAAETAPAKRAKAISKA